MQNRLNEKNFLPITLKFMFSELTLEAVFANNSKQINAGL